MATILVVDDEKPVREFLVAAFEQEGHQVLEAWHGRHALAIIHDSSTPPDLVISDVMMPLVGGSSCAACSGPTPRPPTSRSCS